jgi:molybdopterin-guanine dinucleotide biosynthesis protein B
MKELKFMQNALVPILGFSAASGTGKTTLLTQLIPLLKQQGFRVGLIKHSHHDFEIDKRGKDSYRLRKSGATPVMLVSSHRRAVISEFETPIEPQLNQELKYFEQTELDLILVEGFKTEIFPKIELHREILDQPLFYPNDDNIIAIASDTTLSIPHRLVALDLNNPVMITQFIVQRFLS